MIAQFTQNLIVLLFVSVIAGLWAIIIARIVIQALKGRWLDVVLHIVILIVVMAASLTYAQQ